MELNYDPEEMKERYDLAMERVLEIPDEHILEEKFQQYFKKMAAFLCLMDETYRFVKSGKLKQASLEELQERNRQLYEDILPENYGISYANPTYAEEILGKEHGNLLCFLYTELRALIGYVYEDKIFDCVIRMELFLEIYGMFTCEKEETGLLPAGEALRRTIYWFFSDYSEDAAAEMVTAQVDPDKGFAVRLILDSDLNDVRYLYYFGEYITASELRTARHLAEMSQEQIDLMADTYTQGYRKGFELSGKPLYKKKSVGIHYPLGFERMMKKAFENFEKMGLKPALARNAVSAFEGRSVNKRGFFGANPNKQFDYDHKEDKALFFDAKYCNRRLEVLRSAYEERKQLAAEYAGPAVVEIFGETPFAPAKCEAAYKLNEEQQKLQVKFSSDASRLTNEYINQEERSFTIIAFPTPEIGDQYEEIFDEIVKINTLDYELYSRIQASLIDLLDKADYVRIKGMKGNRTDLKVNLWKLQNPAEETIFENCVADVNIPVGEVFTSPKLTGTNGVLHVTHVFLNELEYKDLSITFQDGMIADYDCANFDTPEENKQYIKENVLFHHDTLPMGEFAIGTNTTAYMVARKYGIGAKMPILIAEKTGPHFAVGDTCYSHEEDMVTCNPDGKKIVARDNEVTARYRKDDPAKAYFNCHTDITIPYDELGELTAVSATGEEYPIIKEGHFVAAGAEELNKPLDDEE